MNNNVPWSHQPGILVNRGQSALIDIGTGIVTVEDEGDPILVMARLTGVTFKEGIGAMTLLHFTKDKYAAVIAVDTPLCIFVVMGNVLFNGPSEVKKVSVVPQDPVGSWFYRDLDMLRSP